MKRFLKSVGLVTMFVLLFAVTTLVVGAPVTFLTSDMTADVSLMLVYFSSMIAVYGVTLLIERLVFKRLNIVYNSRAGFDPVSLLLGVLLIISVSVVILPLEGVISSDSRTFPEGVGTLITVVLLAPIFEEMIFRARLYNILSRNTSPLVSASLSAVAFGVVHMEPIVVIDALIVGVIFSYFYLSKRSIFSPILLHMFNNALAYALIVLSYDGESLSDIVGSGQMSLIIYMVCAAIVLLGAVVIIRFYIMEKRRTRGVECQDMETLSEHHNPDQLAE